MFVKTPKGNDASVIYSFEGIPTDGLIPLYQAYTIEDRVIIQPHLKDATGLLNHELTHVDQWYDHYWFQWRYNNFKSFRFKMEVEAFAVQAKSTGMLSIGKYGYELAKAYGLDKTVKECTTAIISKYSELEELT